ncbi:lysine transporter LysE [Sphingomonas sp. Leaf407]|uniref:LysE family translocator n=1 Tax=unclassified Sphingomonas TaxID=196159 RepID=UPI0006F2753F|nr:MULTISPECIES: LysE family translocator [unclassified Sphingomonas]KQN39380.1 lysine transporter LysE [Sphingomonas sp. Leaf42]KQT28656.1 lysine transporter LysE [Sphingomonas sp. Leaf407]
MDPHLWLGFAAASFVMGVIPGPGVASIIGFAFTSGRATALASVAGMAVGNLIAMSVSLAGAGVILGTSAVAFTILKWIGAAYLIGIGLIAILRSGDDGDPARPPRTVTPRAAFLTNVAVGTFHPKTILFFVAFAAQFIRADQPFVPQAAILIATFVGIAGATDSCYALAASHASGLIRRTSVRRWTRRAGGGAVMSAGVAMALLQR